MKRDFNEVLLLLTTVVSLGAGLFAIMGTAAEFEFQFISRMKVARR